MASDYKLPDQSGRICAYKVLSCKLAKDLIEDGILNRPIAYYPWSNGINTILIFNQDGNYEIADRRHYIGEQFWTPSFISAETWKKAANAFQPQRNLEYNIEHYLLPEMQTYSGHSIDELLNPLICEFLLTHGILNSPIRRTSGDTYYFNDEGIYTLDKRSQNIPCDRSKFYPLAFKYNHCFNMNVWSKAAAQFKPGMTLTECVTIFLNTSLNPRPERIENLKYINRLIQSVSHPEYRRVPGNENKDTFDRIHIVVGLPRFMFQTWGELKAAIKENRSEIDRRVIEKIATDRHFKKYGVPINVIKLSDVLLKKDFSLEYIFELKDIERK